MKSSSESGCVLSSRNRRVPRAPLPEAGVTHSRGDLQSHLRGHYSSFFAHTGSCVRPNPSQRLGGPRTPGPCRLSPVPAGGWPFPTLSLQSLRRRLDPYPAASLECTYPFLPREHRPHATENAFGTRNCPCNATSTGSRISGLQSFDYLQAPTLARPPDCTHRSTFVLGDRAVYTTHRPGGYPFLGCGIATCPTWAIDTAGLAPAGLQPRRLLLPAHGFPVVAQVAALREPRIPNRPAQAAQTKSFEEGTPPVDRLAGTQLRTCTLTKQAPQPLHDIDIQLVKLTCRIARPEVRPPATDHPVHVGNDDARVGVTAAPRGELADTARTCTIARRDGHRWR